MAVDALYQQLWDTNIRYHLDNINVYRLAFTNSDFVGDVRYGATLQAVLVDVPDPTEYTGAWTADDVGTISADAVEFQVTEQEKFLVKLPVTLQNAVPMQLMEVGSQRSAMKINEFIDAYVASLYTEVSGSNVFGDSTTPIVVGFGTGETSPLVALQRLRSKIGAVTPPPGGYNVVIPDWMATMLAIQIGTRQTTLGDAQLQGGAGADIQQGVVATNIAGFKTVYSSSNVPNTAGAKYKVMAGGRSITFAQIIQLVEIVKDPYDFADIVRGLYVFGGKIMMPATMALGTFSEGDYPVNA